MVESAASTGQSITKLADIIPIPADQAISSAMNYEQAQYWFINIHPQVGQFFDDLCDDAVKETYGDPKTARGLLKRNLNTGNTDRDIAETRNHFSLKYVLAAQNPVIAIRTLRRNAEAYVKRTCGTDIGSSQEDSQSALIQLLSDANKNLSAEQKRRLKTASEAYNKLEALLPTSQKGNPTE